MERSEIKNFESLKPEFRSMASYFKAYPDRFLDYISDERTIFKLYFYQRILLRSLFRYRYVYLTLTRGSAKSFTEVLAMFLKCIMHPNGKYFVVAPRKEQASKIVAENFENILNFFPVLENEVDRKKCKFDKDFTRIVTKNGAKMEVVTASDASRGGRKPKVMRSLLVIAGYNITLTAENSLELI